MCRIYDTDTPAEMAYKIYEEFIVLQSCKISGWMEGEPKNGCRTVYPKADFVIDEIMRRDFEDNCHRSKTDGRARRKQRMMPNQIGGYLAQKAFRWQKVMNDGLPVYTIWRIQ